LTFSYSIYCGEQSTWSWFNWA